MSRVSWVSRRTCTKTRHYESIFFESHPLAFSPNRILPFITCLPPVVVRIWNTSSSFYPFKRLLLECGTRRQTIPLTESILSQFNTEVTPTWTTTMTTATTSIKLVVLTRMGLQMRIYKTLCASLYMPQKNRAPQEGRLHAAAGITKDDHHHRLCQPGIFPAERRRDGTWCISFH